MKNKKLSPVLIMVLTFFITSICLAFSMNPKSVLADDNTEAQKANNPNSYFSWKNDWQNNNRVSISNESDFKPIVGEYNYRLSRTFSFDLLEGDTKPMLITGTDTFYLMTPIDEDGWPEFKAVKPNREYEYTNYTYWKNLPSNLDGKFTSSLDNWPNVDHWAGWPRSEVKSSAYSMFVGDKPVTYTFSKDVPNNPTYTLETQVNVGSYIPPGPELADKGWAMTQNLSIPQLVKAVFKDVDNPDGPSLSEDDILGMHGEIGDSVTTKSKDIKGYNFISSQIILGPKLGFPRLEGIILPENFVYYDKDSSVKDPTPDDSWATTLDTQQKGIVFWYKKKKPNISLTKQVNKTEAFVGETLTYNINTANNGDADLVNAKITDKVPEGLSKPSNIKLDNDLLPENQGNDGKYYTWNNTTNELTVFTGNLKINENKKLTYDTTIINGTPGETKTNYAELSGDNSNQSPSGNANVTVKQKIITLDIEDIMATTGDTDISVSATINAETDFTDLVNGTLTIKYPQENLSLGNMKVTQNGKDITYGTTIDKSIKNIVKIQGINANNIKEYPVAVQFNQSSALIEMDRTAFTAGIQSEDLSSTATYNVEIKKGELQLLWVPNMFDFGSHNLEQLNQNQFDTITKLPAYVVVSDMRSKSDIRTWRVAATSSDMTDSSSSTKITDLSYNLGDNKLKEYTANDNSIPPSGTTIGPAPESWKDLVTVESDLAIQNKPASSSDIVSTKKGVENGKYAIEVNQATLKLNNLNEVTGKNYDGVITWTLIDSL
ncbi:hypothetical protein [Enterococcus faecalis]|uniref:hypothetical protein n=1 Tax=Enterococcus faecalis TaxID=1351 RepID=UPI002542D42C|nr:hypothetical protein [Enterococcus faecalis]MDK4396682.1 DUF11 domain-containing protein [Enterococcus faecalis]MDK4415196.1 DUF11 domain-containing protein [Enterococcus faecalis]